MAGVFLEENRSRGILTLMKTGFLCGLLAIAFSMPAQNTRSGAVASAVGSFDVPLKKEVVDFGPSPYYPNPRTAPRVKLSCYYFPAFMVKQYDSGQKGADWLSIVPSSKAAAPSCSRSHAPDEVVTDGSGYFGGAKANLVFFTGPDGQDGGMPFEVFDSRTGKKIFEDVAYDSGFINMRFAVSPFNKLRVSAVSLKYLRVQGYDCDLHLSTKRNACWEKIKVQAGLGNRPIPVCIRYEQIHSQYSSAVAYPVEVSLLPQPTSKTIAGPVRCWPED